MVYFFSKHVNSGTIILGATSIRQYKDNAAPLFPFPLYSQHDIMHTAVKCIFNSLLMKS